MSKIITSYQPSFIPILRILAAAGHEITTLHPDFTRQLRDLDIAAKSLGEGIPDVRGPANTRAVEILESVDTSADSLSPQVAQFMANSLKPYIYGRIGELASIAFAVDATAPDLCLLHNDVEPSTRVVALWARARNTPCLHIPHAVYVDGFGRGAIGTDVHDIVTASHIACAGPYQEQWYQNRGGTTRITGLPQFDKWATMPVTRKRARTNLGLDQHKLVVVYASSWRQDTNLLGCHDGVEETYRNFLEATKEFNDIQFVVKTHPRGGNIEWHVKTAQELKCNVTVTALHLEHCLQAADAVIAYGPSGVIIEAAHVEGLRLLCIDGYQNDSNILTTTSDSKSIADALGISLATPQPNNKSFVYKYAGIPDGLATQRVTQYALELIP